MLRFLLASTYILGIAKAIVSKAVLLLVGPLNYLPYDGFFKSWAGVVSLLTQQSVRRSAAFNSATGLKTQTYSK